MGEWKEHELTPRGWTAYKHVLNLHVHIFVENSLKKFICFLCKKLFLLEKNIFNTKS